RDPLVSELSQERAALGLLGPRRATLKLWVAVVALVHFDRGAATVAAMDVSNWGNADSHGASFGHAVVLLAWHSIGLAVGNSLAGSFFQQASAKAMLLMGLTASLTFSLAFGLQENPGVFITAVLRLGSGVAAALPLVYLPFWVDEFSPPEGHGQWMSIVQTGVPIGQFCGVLAGAVAEDQRSWRNALLGQAALLFLVLLRLAIIPAQQIDAANPSLTARLDSLALHSPDAQLGRLQNLMRELREMLQGVNRNPLTLSLSSVLCLLHATGAGLALWTAPYLALSDGAPSPLVSLMLAALILSCCPAAGTYVGAIACYRVDGFKAGMHAVALRVACAFAALAALCAPLNSASSSFILRLFLVACWLFSAGALLPISAGLLMTSMPSYLRSFSSASTVLVLHVVSFSVMPGVAAVLMGCFIRPEKHKPIGRQEYLQLTISDVDSYEQGASIRSDITGPSGSFRCCLKVYPKGTVGTERSVSNALAAFVEIIPPPSVKESSWVCKDVEYGIAVRRNVESHTAELSRSDTFSFDQDHEDRGWHDIIRWNDNKWTATSSISICAEVRGLPVADALISDLQGVSFEDELQPVSFHLSACTLFFDQRLLVARSDYFREMFAQSQWMEGQTKEVDLRSDPLATKAAMSAILRYIVSGSFHADGDVDLAFAVRFLADRYCLKELVQLAESELLAMLCPENALSFLGRLSDLKSSNCLELACWKMIQADGCKLLEQQHHQLSQLIEENPTVAKQLILLNGLSFGVGLMLWATLPAAILLLFAYAREPKGSGPAGSLSGVDDLTFSDISYELARRRMSTSPL
ncbi:unnamed protein product, partial [Symbiodinium sp. CCMP2456]